MFILKNMFTLVRRFCHLSRVFSNFSKRKTFFCSTASLLSLAQSTKLFVSKLYSVLHCTAPLWLPLALKRRAEASAVWRKGNCLKAKPVGRIGCQRSGSGWLGAVWGRHFCCSLRAGPGFLQTGSAAGVLGVAVLDRVAPAEADPPCGHSTPLLNASLCQPPTLHRRTL